MASDLEDLVIETIQKREKWLKKINEQEQRIMEHL